MSGHWRLAIWYAVRVAVVAIVLGAGVWFLYGPSRAVALGYGVGVGTLSMLSTAATVSFLTGRNEVLKALGAMSFMFRYLFVLGALGVPAVVGAWPVLPMLLGFSGVYLAEHVFLIPAVLRRVNALGKVMAAASSGRVIETERRVEA